MGKKKYCIGVDFGSKSGRAVLIEVDSGKEAAVAVKEYKHGVMDEYLPDHMVKLPPDWALQHPADYLEVLQEAIPAVIHESGVSPDDIIGVGIDFTSSTVLPIDKEGIPLCFHDKFKSNPHAYAKLWKHHAAQKEANKLNEVANARGESFLKRYGGKISSEWMIPKIWQTLNESPEIYESADSFIEAADWIVLQLTGEEKRNICMAGFKAIWSKETGYPKEDFFRALSPSLEDVVEKLSSNICFVGSKAGGITRSMSVLTGLKEGTAVSVACIDAHIGLPAVEISAPGMLCMIIGTGTGLLFLYNEAVFIPGISGVNEDGIVPGYYAYEAGQNASGDIFEWFTKNSVSAAYEKEAETRGIGIHQLLREKAMDLKPGESGLIALDWWNGNRSMLVDNDLTGLILGCTIMTRPEEIYRSLIEATAYGIRVIMDSLQEYGIHFSEIRAAGGIALKDELLMQIYADVINMEINVSASAQTCALGAAMFASVAAGKSAGGYDNIADATKNMAIKDYRRYRPVPDNVAVYDKLYIEYKKLHDYFGCGENNVMKHLKNLRKAVKKAEDV